MLAFRRLTKHYPQTLSMQRVVKSLAEEKISSDRSISTKFFGLLWRRKFSIIFLSGVTYAW